MKRTLIALLTVIMAFSAVSCAQKPQETPDPVSETQPESAQTEEVNFYGEEFVLATNWSGFYKPNISQNSGRDADAKLKKFSDTEAKLNCIITVEQVDAFDAKFFSRFTTGESNTDMLDCFAYTMFNMYKAGQLTPYEDIACIDLDDEEKWGTRKFRQPITWNGETYGVWYAKWPYMPEYYGSLMYNTELINYFGATDPAELYEKGDWTLTNFKSMLEQCNEPSDDKSVNIYGMAVYSDELETLAKMSVFANGGGLVKEKDGSYIFGYSEPEAIEALEWCRDVYNTPNLVTLDGYEPSVFPVGLATFEAGVSWIGVVNSEWAPLQTLKGGFNWIHFPVGSNGQNGKTFGSFISGNLRYIAIPFDAEADNVGALMNELFSEIEEYPFSEHLLSLRSNYFFFDSGFKYYMEAVNNANYTYSHILEDYNADIDSTLQKIVKGNVTAAEGIESISSMLNDAVSSALNK